MPKLSILKSNDSAKVPAQAVMQIIYPKSSASSFNLDYYLKHHMPLVEKAWGPQGITSWSVSTGDKGADYHVQTLVFWKSMEAIEEMTEVAAILEDVKNFTDATPTQWMGRIVGSSAIKSV
ncbi:hypothetical protein BKA64DRAFT_705665 [Cadophora sp. MPI-SDFR-AT-0126]|nr:hypothetical protein BKA64DRAFT_705665 [Leotiomycetes sp. MPI-SDFR-AT-0126]